MRVLQLFCGAFALSLAACTGKYANDPETIYSAVHTVSGDAPVVVTLPLEPGTYLIEAREQAIDLRVSFDGAGVRSTSDDAVPRHGLHARVVSIGAPASLRIELLNSDHRTKQGTALVRAARWRRGATEPSGERELGYLAFGLAGEQTAARNQDSWARAAALLNESAAHFDKAGDEAGQAQAQYTLGHLQYLERDDRLAAVRAAEAATESYKDVGDEAGVQNAAMLRAASELEIAAGMNAGTQRAEQRALYAAADRRLADAAKFFEANGLPVNAEYATNMRGVRAVYLGEHDAAVEFLTRAVALSRANHDVGEEVKSLANLAWVHFRLGFVAEAGKEYSELMPLIDPVRQPAVYGAILNNYGFCLIALGDFDRALELHTQALQMFMAQGTEIEQARQLHALGDLYLRTGDLHRSLETLRAAIEMQERISDTIGRAIALRMAANAASALGQHDLALEYLHTSAEIEADPHGVARTQVLIARELRLLGNLRGAESELTKVIESRNPLTRAEVLEERGRLRLLQKNYTAAVNDLREANAQYATLGLEFNRIDANSALSQGLLAVGDVPGALAAANQAVATVSRIRVTSANPEWRARFVSSRYQPYEVLIAAELASGGPSDAGSTWRAFRIAENVRARSLADLLADEPRRGARAIDSTGDGLRSQLTSLQMRLETRMQKLDADEEGTLALRRAIAETRAQIDAHLVRQEAVAAGNSVLTESLKELQSRLPPDTAVLAYFVGDARSQAWLLRRNELRMVTLGSRTQLARAADEFVEQTRFTQPRGARPSDMGTLLLGSLLDGVVEKKLLVIPDGPLNGVPFAAVPVPGHAGEILVDRFVLGYAPSLTLAMQGSHDKSRPDARVAVVYDPVYAADDRRLIAANRTGGVLRGQLAASPNKFTRLPHSALEARAVAGALGAAEIVQLSGFEATRARVVELARGNLSVLHFATHAVARADSPEQSALFLSEYSPEGALLPDSRLSVGEIRRIGLRADLVVLSGCDTGDGGRLRGEGVLGLAYGFLANGSHSVVAALWPIEDASTARFMNEFYTAYRASGRAAEALRTAQLRTRKSADSGAWSSFVVRANEFP